jgi:CRISPR-associated endonuclease Cas2
MSPHLICYDISADGLRAAAGKKILEYGLDRINKSVYLGTLGESSLKALETQLADMLKTKGDPQDSLIILPVAAAQIHQMRVLGRNDLDKAELTGDKSTLLL